MVGGLAATLAAGAESDLRARLEEDLLLSGCACFSLDSLLSKAVDGLVETDKAGCWLIGDEARDVLGGDGGLGREGGDGAGARIGGTGWNGIAKTRFFNSS